MRDAFRSCNWREKLEASLADDELRGTQPVGTRPQDLDDVDILPAAPPPPASEELADAIQTHRSEVKNAFQVRKELGKPAEAEKGSKATITHVGAFDEAKINKYEADMFKRFGDKVPGNGGTAHEQFMLVVMHLFSSCRWQYLGEASSQLATSSNRKQAWQSSVVGMSCLIKETFWQHLPNTRSLYRFLS